MNRSLKMILPFTFTALLSFTGVCRAVPTPSKPALILVPGAFHKAAVYHEVKRHLSDVGYNHIHAVELPSVGPAAAKVDRTPDIKAVQRIIRQEVGHGHDIVLVGNSYGATVIGEAVKDFESLSSVRGTAPAHGKILGLIMLSGFIPYISELSGTRPDIRVDSPSWMRFEDTSLVYWDGNLTSFPPSSTFYNLLHPVQSTYWSAQLAPSSFAALNATAQYIPYDGKFRSLYVIGENDHAVTPDLAQTYISQAGAKFETLTIDGDHIPMLSRPEKVVEIIRQFAGEKV